MRYETDENQGKSQGNEYTIGRGSLAGSLERPFEWWTLSRLGEYPSQLEVGDKFRIGRVMISYLGLQ